MRTILIGIIIGIVLGVMVGATVVAPGLEQARVEPPQTVPSGAESLPIDGPIPSPTEAVARPSTTPTKTAGAVQLRITSLFAPKLPVLGEMAQRLETGLGATAGGTLDARLYAPGTLVPEADTFDAVASGTVEAAFATPAQWIGDSPVSQLFTAIPFGPNATEMLAWFYHGGGREIFEQQFTRIGVHGELCGAIPPEGSGWYLNPMRMAQDFEGLTIHAAGLGAKVLETMGATTVALSAGEVLAAFEERRLDGAQFSLPSVDLQMGFQKFARNYYFPGWQQPVTLFVLGINAKVWDGLSAHQRSAIRQTCGDNVRFALTRADALQFEALKQLGLAGVQVRRWPAPVLESMKNAWKSVQRELIQQDPDFATTWASLQRFRRDYSIWQDLSRP